MLVLVRNASTTRASCLPSVSVFLGPGPEVVSIFYKSALSHFDLIQLRHYTFAARALMFGVPSTLFSSQLRRNSETEFMNKIEVHKVEPVF